VTASLKGGAAHHVFHLARGLRDLGHSIEIAAPSDEPALRERFHTEGLPFHDIPLDDRLPFNAFFQLQAVIERRSFSHVHVHGHRAAFITRPATAMLHNAPPLVYTVHGYHPPYYPRALERLLVNGLEWGLSAFTDAFICVSASVRDELEAALPNLSAPRFVIDNGIPTYAVSPERFQQLRVENRKRYGISENAFVIGIVARLQWQKGVERLIQAFSSLRQTPSPLYLLIVGDGPDRSRLERLAREKSITDRCVFTGYCSNTEAMYPTMDLFVLPSLWEGLPLTVLEAWNAGIPVVAANVSGTRDVIEDNINGYLAENSTEGITQAIQRALTSTSQFPAIIQNATESLNERFSVERMVQQTAAVYSQVVE